MRILRTKVLVIGQGLAGSVLAMKLLQHKIPFILIDDPEIQASSTVAGGIMNPIIFRHLTLSWRAPAIFHQATAFYSALDQLFRTQTLQPVEILRIFNATEDTLWQSKIEMEIFKHLLIKQELASEHQLPLNHPNGFGKVMNAAWLNTVAFLGHVRSELESNGCLKMTKFQYKDLVLYDDHVSYLNFEAEKIVFCEGHHLTHNPWFNHIPMRPVKGEILTIKADIPDIEVIISGDVFLLPLGNGFFKVGSTYVWDDLTELPTDAAKKALIAKLSILLTVPFEVIKHEAGIRPAIADRKPVVGFHPWHKNLLVMNGLGSKGVMLAPLLADYITGKIRGDDAVDEEIDVSRFNRYLLENFKG